MCALSVRAAIDVFAQSFAAQRSLTHPYVVAREGRLTVLHDAPRTSGDMRTQEILVDGLSPQEAMREVAAYAPQGKFLINVFCHMDDDMPATREAYKVLGYRLMVREPLMAFDLSRKLPLTPAPSSWQVQRASTPEQAQRVAKAARKRLIDPAELARKTPKMRLYFVEMEGVPVAWVRSVHLRKPATWVADLFTHPAHRHKGIASALMRAMLADDARAGARHSVLLASMQGAPLYRKLGYDDLAVLHMFAPP